MPRSAVFNQSLVAFKQQLTKKLTMGIAIFFSIALPLSLSRWYEIGFHFVFVHQILLTIIIFVSWLTIHKTYYKVNLLVIVILLSSMIVSGTLTFGLQTGAATFVVFCTFIIALAWGFYAAFVYAFSWCAFLLFVGYLFADSYLTYTVSPSEYSKTMGSWVIVALGSSLIIILMLIIAKQAFEFFSSLIQEIEDQKVAIENLANTDTLTGFSNARLAMPLLNQAIKFAHREHSKVGVVFIDLNGFKTINDIYGHDAGDTVLQEVATRMRTVLRDMDIACRIGGDEFLIIIPKVKDDSEIRTVLQRVVETWNTPITLQDINISINGSIGVAMFPDNAKTAQSLRNKADTAMYQAKNKGLAIEFFT